MELSESERHLIGKALLGEAQRWEARAAVASGTYREELLALARDYRALARRFAEAGAAKK